MAFHKQLLVMILQDFLLFFKLGILVPNYETEFIGNFQRKGLYPSPPGESDILGLEAAGTVEKHGPGCFQKWKLGDRVMALLTGICSSR